MTVKLIDKKWKEIKVKFCLKKKNLVMMRIKRETNHKTRVREVGKI